MEAGDIILIPPALLELPYMVTAKAVTDLLVIMIPAEDSFGLRKPNLRFPSRESMLAGHSRLLFRHLTQTKSRDANTRVIQYLMDGYQRWEGSAQFALPGSKRDLAAHLASRQSIVAISEAPRTLGVTSAGSEMHMTIVSRLSALFHIRAMRLPINRPSPAAAMRAAFKWRCGVDVALLRSWPSLFASLGDGTWNFFRKVGLISTRATVR